MTDRNELDQASPAAQGQAEERPRSPEAVRDAIKKVVEPAIATHRCELVDIEWRREPIGWVLRLYVERLGHDPRLQIGGVLLEDCVAISRDVSTAMDVAEIVDHAYNLEVSSPGLDRPLTRAAEYERFKGLRAKMRISPPMPAYEGRRNYKGEILGLVEQDVLLRDDEVGDVKIPFTSVQKANLVFEPPPKTKPGKGPGKQKKHSEKHR
ncbi:MAG: ribosome maturation factor RimP [Polyangiales bacterium]